MLELEEITAWPRLPLATAVAAKILLTSDFYDSNI